MILHPVEKKSGVTRQEFIKNYLKANRPLVFRDLAADWTATQRWTFDFLKNQYGDLRVPIHDSTYREAGKNYMRPVREVPFREYLDAIQAGPTDWRIFLFNLFKHAPELAQDIQTPTIMDGFIKEYPFMFFGGAGSATPMHYDIDCSSVFLTHFWTRKRVILFAPDQSNYLYQLPFTVHSPVNPVNPNYDKYPAFQNAVGLDTTLEHGETLFIPSTFWHYIYYTDGGFSIALRANDSLTTQLRGLTKIARHYVVDKSMNLLLGARWKDWKEKTAIRRAECMYEV